MKPTFARALLLVPVFGLWLEGCVSFFWLVVLGIVTLAWLTKLDDKRGPHRTPISVLIARIFAAMWAISFVLLALCWNNMTGGNFWSFWEICWASMATTLFITGWYWVFNKGGEQLIKNHPDYRQFKAAGGHHFWDTLPRILNPDSDVVRRGGVREPEYTDFVPPADWRFQCPVCGARLQFNPDVCWRCNYGADGDSSAWYDDTAWIR